MPKVEREHIQNAIDLINQKAQMFNLPQIKILSNISFNHLYNCFQVELQISDETFTFDYYFSYDYMSYATKRKETNLLASVTGILLSEYLCKVFGFYRNTNFKDFMYVYCEKEESEETYSIYLDGIGGKLSVKLLLCKREFASERCLLEFKTKSVSHWIENALATAIIVSSLTKEGDVS